MPSLRTPSPTLAALAAVVTLGACGGNGSDGDRGAVAGSSSSATSAPASSTGAMAATSAGSASDALQGFFGAEISRGAFSGLLDGPSDPAEADRTFLQGAAQQTQAPRWEYYDFYFTRAIYGGGGLGRGGFYGRGGWATDFPKADRQFLVVLGETLDLLRVPDQENAVFLEDPALRRFPFLYTLEVGRMYLSQEQVEGLRGYLQAGGFLVVDDFWGDYEWLNFEQQMSRVFPEHEIVDLPLDHEIFHVFYDIEEILQVPNVNNAAAGVTSECGPCQPRVRGIFDDDGRLMVVINWNTDLGDAWEWSEQPVYPFRYSNYAYKMAVNFIVYAMTH